MKKQGSWCHKYACSRRLRAGELVRTLDLIFVSVSHGCRSSTYKLRHALDDPVQAH